MSVMLVLPAYSDVKKEKSELVSRVQARWSLIEKGDYLKAYEFETPEFKKVFSNKLFAASFGYDVNWKLLNVVEVDIKESSDLAPVTVNVATSSAGVEKDKNVIPVLFYEKWLHINGQWWHSFDK